MIEIARLSLLLTCLVGVYTGARTLWIWWGTRMLAELSVGTTVLSISAAGVLFTVGGMIGGEAGLGPVLFVVAQLMLALHIASVQIGNWRIFRARSAWALALALFMVALSGLYLGSAVFGWLPQDSITLLQRSCRLFGMGWAAYECFRHSAMLRKRVAFGLADGFTAHRVWLWGLGASGQALCCTIELFATWRFAVNISSMPLGFTIHSVIGLVGIGSIALAFFPPAFYREKFREDPVDAQPA